MLDKKGFTILEVIMSMAIFGIVIVGALNIFSYATNRNAIFRAEHELNQMAQISMEHLTKHIREAESMELITTPNNTLVDVWLRRDTAEIRRFSYDANHPQNRNWLMFGGAVSSPTGATQELTRYIGNVEMIVDEKRSLLHITIITDISTASFAGELSEPIILRRTLDISHMTIEIR